MKIKNDEVMQIGELAEMLGITTRTIRYYEEIGIMEAPQRLEGGMRVYAKEDILRLKFILKLKEIGLNLKEMHELADIYRLHKDSDRIMPKLLEFLDEHIQKIDEKMSRLASLRKDIADYRVRISDILKDKALS
ncbi:MAG: MerR family transcriptional regulator [Trichloromonadaceae bacterium]